MRKSLCSVRLGLSFILLFSSRNLYSLEIQNLITDWEQKLSDYEAYYFLSLSIVILIALFGAVSGFIQTSSLKQRFFQVLAVSCAFLVSLITVITTAVDMSDHKSLRIHINKIEKEISDLKLIQANAALSDNLDYQRELLKQVTKVISKLHAIENEFVVASLEIIPLAYANEDSLQFEAKQSGKVLSKLKEQIKAQILSDLKSNIEKQYDLQKLKLISEKELLDLIFSELFEKSSDLKFVQGQFEISQSFSISKEKLDQIMSIYLTR